MDVDVDAVVVVEGSGRGRRKRSALAPKAPAGWCLPLGAKEGDGSGSGGVLNGVGRGGGTVVRCRGKHGKEASNERMCPRIHPNT